MSADQPELRANPMTFGFATAGFHSGEVFKHDIGQQKDKTTEQKLAEIAQHLVDGDDAAGRARVRQLEAEVRAQLPVDTGRFSDTLIGDGYPLAPEMSIQFAGSDGDPVPPAGL